MWIFFRIRQLPFIVAMGKSVLLFVWFTQQRLKLQYISCRYCSSAKILILSPVENFIVSVHYTNYLITLWFNIQFIRVSYNLDARIRIRNSIKSRNKKSAEKGNTTIIDSRKTNINKENIRKILNWKKI